MAKEAPKPRKVTDMSMTRVKFKDVFHLKNLYVMMHEYLADEEWAGNDIGEFGIKAKHPYESHADIETLYLEKFCQKGLHQGGKEMWVWWRLAKFPEGKFSAYFKYHLDIDMHMVYMQDMEVVHQGKKMKVQKGEMEIFLRPWIESDIDSKWRKHWLLKHFIDLYEKRVLSQEIEKREKELWREIYRFQGIIKRFLNMRTFIPVPEPFHPAIYGYEGEPKVGGPLPTQ